MTYQERTTFINELTESVRDDLLAEAKKYPDTWDGIELRWRVADVFGQVVFGSIGDRKGKRYKDYKNICLVDNYI